MAKNAFSILLALPVLQTIKIEAKTLIGRLFNLSSFQIFLYANNTTLYFSKNKRFPGDKAKHVPLLFRAF
jgi:hypothetical protein